MSPIALIKHLANSGCMVTITADPDRDLFVSISKAGYADGRAFTAPGWEVEDALNAAYKAFKSFRGAPLPAREGAGGMGAMRHREGGDA